MGDVRSAPTTSREASAILVILLLAAGALTGGSLLRSTPPVPCYGLENTPDAVRAYDNARTQKVLLALGGLAFAIAAGVASVRLFRHAGSSALALVYALATGVMAVLALFDIGLAALLASAPWCG
jgi:hypothetical protein